MTLFIYLTTILTYFNLLIFRAVLEKSNIGVNAHNVKLDFRLITLKPLHSKWIPDMFKFMRQSKVLDISGLAKHNFFEVATKSATLINIWENTFKEIELVADIAL